VRTIGLCTGYRVKTVSTTKSDNVIELIPHQNHQHTDIHYTV